MSNLLSLTAGIGQPGSGSTPRPANIPQDFEKAQVIYQDMKEKQITISESGYSALIRCACLHERLDQAMYFYQEMIVNGQIHPKLRTISYLLHTLSQNKQHLDQCFSLFHEMIQQHAINPTEKEYQSLLRVCYYDSNPRFYEVLDEMMDDLLVLSYPETIQLIKDWFGKPLIASSSGYVIEESKISKVGVLECNQEQLQLIDLDDENRLSILNQLDICVLQRDYTPSTNSNNNNNNANNNHPTITYKANNKVKEYKQHLLKERQEKQANKQQLSQQIPQETSNLTSNQVLEDNNQLTLEPENNQPQETIQETNSDNHQEITSTDNHPNDASNPSQKPPHRDLQQMKNHWETFKQFLQDHQSQYNIIVDGANVGYFKQNYADAPIHVDYEQINQVLHRLLALNYKPLLILNARHLSSKLMPQCEPYLSIVNSWKHELKCLYVTPRGLNDDWFWMYAAVKYNYHIVTTDEMRDHHFQLLSPRYFYRWRECHRVCFDIYFTRVKQDQQTNACDQSNPYQGDLIQYSTGSTAKNSFFCAANRRIKIKWPLPFSYRMQKIISNNYVGYYLPPLVKLPDREVLEEEQEVVTNPPEDEDREVNEKQVSKQSTTAPLPTILPPNNNVESTLIEDLTKEWLCIYQPIEQMNQTSDWQYISHTKKRALDTRTTINDAVIVKFSRFT